MFAIWQEELGPRRHRLRAVIGNAVALRLPVLVGVNRLNLGAFDEFSGGLAEWLSPDKDILVSWLCNTAATTAMVA